MRNLGSEISGQENDISQIRFVKIQKVCDRISHRQEVVNKEVWDRVFYDWTTLSDYLVYDFLKASNIRAEAR